MVGAGLELPGTAFGWWSLYEPGREQGAYQEPWRPMRATHCVSWPVPRLLLLPSSPKAFLSLFFVEGR